LSPVLFSLFLKDLTEFLSHSYDGLSNVYNAIHIFLDTEEFAVYFRLYLLLYVDDTVILAESVNVSKTNIVIFRKGSYKLNDNLVFSYNGQNIDIVNEFRERPFNLKEGGGGYVFFLKKYSDSQGC
jgi:hypothetical protein